MRRDGGPPWAGPIAPPLAGSGWIAIVGAHRRAVQSVDGALDNGQRFAVDFAARLDASGRALVGDPALNPSWVNFGAPVLAVGDATVVTAVDRFPDQPPDKPAQTGVEEADGNHVILRLADGTYAGYHHRERRARGVRAGQRVRAVRGARPAGQLREHHRPASAPSSS